MHTTKAIDSVDLSLSAVAWNLAMEFAINSSHTPANVHGEVGEEFDPFVNHHES
jgi:hypothetical protein